MFFAQWAAEWTGGLLKSAGHPQLLQQIPEQSAGARPGHCWQKIKYKVNKFNLKHKVFTKVPWHDFFLMGEGRGLGTKVIFNHENSHYYKIMGRKTENNLNASLQINGK